MSSQCGFDVNYAWMLYLIDLKLNIWSRYHKFADSRKNNQSGFTIQPIQAATTGAATSTTPTLDKQTDADELMDDSNQQRAKEIRTPISAFDYVNELLTTHAVGQPRLSKGFTIAKLGERKNSPKYFIIDQSCTVIAQAYVLVPPGHHVPKGTMTSRPAIRKPQRGHHPLAFVQGQVSVAFDRRAPEANMQICAEFA
jgi:hypothetical protein